METAGQLSESLVGKDGVKLQELCGRYRGGLAHILVDLKNRFLETVLGSDSLDPDEAVSPGRPELV